MEHFNITFEPDGKKISIHAGATILEAAGLSGIILNTTCGSEGTCKKCLVKIQPGDTDVLACQHHIQSDLTVTIPMASRFFEQKILSEGTESQNQIQPDIYKKYQNANTETNILGLAIDIGTTTVVAKLIDMSNGKCLATQADINPQASFGDDVISRIAYAATDEKLTELHQIIINCLNQLTKKLCKQAAITTEDIYEICVAANTTMNHIFLKYPITSLGQAPYKPHSIDAKDIPAADFNLHLNPAGNIHTIENIAGFVGSDTTAVALAVDMNLAEQLTLVVDIGTNGEIVLGTKDKLFAASCAAGPALEGARISQGSRAADGAIEAVIINEHDIDIDVIGNIPPHSICGSGLIDAVAVMLDLGIIDMTGRFVEPEKLKNDIPPAILARLTEKNNQPAFILAHHKNSDHKVLLTQKDIRELQLAKAAIRTGIKLLQKKLNVTDDQIQNVLLAGAFGSYIRKESALRIGLLPELPHERIHFVGNAACSGAQLILLSSQARDMAKDLARKIEYIEIAHETEFSIVYADSMLF